MAVDDPRRRHAGLVAGAPPSAGARRRSCPTRRGAPCRRSGGRGSAGGGVVGDRRRRGRSPRSSHVSSPSGVRAEQLLEQRRRCAAGAALYARTPSKPCSACSAGISGCSAVSGASPAVTHGELVAEALGVGEAQARRRRARARRPRRARRCGPEVQRLRRRPRARRSGAPCPAPARPGVACGYSKKVSSAPGRPQLVGVEQVVDAGVVLVDRLGHQAQAEHARVEVDVARARRP